jgi:hypothetical protein
MIQKIKRSIVVTVASLMVLAPGLVPVFAATTFADTITGNLCTGVEDAAQSGAAGCGNAGNGNGTDALKNVAARITNVFSVIVGIAAVIMIIYGGFRYITSGGDSGRVGSAKNSLIYAIIGLIIVALAQIIVHYVINTATTSTTGIT